MCDDEFPELFAMSVYNCWAFRGTRFLDSESNVCLGVDILDVYYLKGWLVIYSNQLLGIHVYFGTGQTGATMQQNAGR